MANVADLDGNQLFYRHLASSVTFYVHPDYFDLASFEVGVRELHPTYPSISLDAAPNLSVIATPEQLLSWITKMESAIFAYQNTKEAESNGSYVGD